MKTRIDALRHEAGFTIIEILIAMFVLLVGVLATTTMLNTANATTDRNQARNNATNLVRDLIEASRALNYDQANPTKDSSGAADNTIITALQAMSPTSGGSSFSDSNTSKSGWQITRRGVEYTITLSACVVDDAKDGVVANHTPAAVDGSGYYCPDLPAIPPGDGNGDDYRRVTVKAEWTTNSCGSCSGTRSPAGKNTFSVSQTGVIVNPSGGLGPPPVGSPVWSNPTSCSSATVSQAFRPNVLQAVFSVRDPANTTFTANTFTTDASGNHVFSFTYNPSTVPPDGSYQVDVNGLNPGNGLPGNSATTFIYINCHQPPAVASVSGGFDWRRCTAYPASCGTNERIFDLDWSPSTPDTDILGYYVWRVNGLEDWMPVSSTSPQPAGTRPPSDPADDRVACVSRALSPPGDTTQIPGQLDFLEGPFQPTCWDQSLPNPPTLVNPGGLIFIAGTREKYWIQAVDSEPPASPNPTIPFSLVPRTTGLTNHSTTLDVTENLINIRPTSPTLSVQNSNGVPCLSWTNSVDLTFLGTNIVNPVRYYRIYRDTNAVATISVTYFNGNANVSVNVPDVPYKDRIGRVTPNGSGSCDTTNPGRSWFKDTEAGTSNWNYWVTAVDQDYLESFPSNTVNWTAP